MSKYIQGYKYITIHHTASASATTKDDLPALARSFENYHKTKDWAEEYKTGGEFGYYYVSYHYLFAQDGSYIQVHDTKYMRIHATDNARGATSHNYHGIAIAIVGNMMNQQPSDKLLEGIARLCAQLEKQYGVSFTIRGHKETAVKVVGSTVYYPEKTGVFYTDCPGAYMGSSTSGAVRTIIDKTNAILSSKPWYETIEAKEMKLVSNDTAYLYNIDTGEQIKTYLPEVMIDTSYVLGDYYITGYSVLQKTKYGFKKSEWHEYVPPIAEPAAPTDKELLNVCNIDKKLLGEKYKALEESYKLQSEDMDEKNFQIEELNNDVNEANTKYSKLEMESAEKDKSITRLTNDVAWCDDQIKEKDDKIKELDDKISSMSAQYKPIVEMDWGVIIAGIFTKIFKQKMDEQRKTRVTKPE